MLSYDYAIVRVLPRVERGEQLNAGVILSCASAAYLQARFELDEAALRCMAPGLTWSPSAPRWQALRRCVPAARPPGRWAGCRRANASTGWWRRAAPVCRCRLCTPAVAPIWTRHWTT